MNTPSRIAIKRFEQFKLAISRELGERVSLTYDGAVIVHAGPFSSECRFHSLQAALDSYSPWGFLLYSHQALRMTQEPLLACKRHTEA